MAHCGIQVRRTAVYTTPQHPSLAAEGTKGLGREVGPFSFITARTVHSAMEEGLHSTHSWLVSVTSMRTLSVTGTGRVSHSKSQKLGEGDTEYLLSHYTVLTLSTQDSSIISRFYGTSNLPHGCGLGVIRRTFPGVTSVHLPGSQTHSLGFINTIL